MSERSHRPRQFPAVPKTIRTIGPTLEVTVHGPAALDAESPTIEIRKAMRSLERSMAAMRRRRRRLRQLLHQAGVHGAT